MMMKHLLLILLFETTCLGFSASPPKRVAVIGGTGNLGRAAVTELSNKGYGVKVLVRFDPAQVPEGPVLEDLYNSTANIRSHLKALPNVELVQGDATSRESLNELVKGCDAVLALHGATRRSKLSDMWKADAEQEPGHAKQINFEGIRTLIEAAQESGTCKRIVRITGLGESPSSFFSVLINMLGSMAKGWNYEGECLLRKSSSVDYTIIRPGVMKVDRREPDEAILNLADNGADLPVTPVSYEDIASLCVQSLEYDNAARATLTAMNTDNGETSYAPLLAKVKADTRKFPPTLIDEHKQAVKNALRAIAVVLATFVVGAASILKSWIFR